MKWSEVSGEPSAPSFDVEPIQNYTFEANQDNDLQTIGQIRTLKGTLSNETEFKILNPSIQKSQKGKSMADLFNLTKHHGRNVTGKGVKIAIFDSGLADKYIRENKEIE